MSLLRALRSLRPVLHRYEVFSGKIPELQIVEATLPEGFQVVRLSEDALEIVDKGRPGYSTRAGLYLRAGYLGWAVVTEGVAVSLSWAAVNLGKKHTTVRKYFRLFPGEGYGFAEWTHPDFRRRQLQTVLGTTRREHLRSVGAHTLVSNIEAGNEASIRKTLQEGRSRIDRISMLSIGNTHFVLKQRNPPPAGSQTTTRPDEEKRFE